MHKTAALTLTISLDAVKARIEWKVGTTIEQHKHTPETILA